MQLNEISLFDTLKNSLFVYSSLVEMVGAFLPFQRFFDRLHDRLVNFYSYPTPA